MPERPVAGVPDDIARAAALPFRIVESFGVGCGYERSVKLRAGRLLANRYLLGIGADDVRPAQWLEACRRLDMPSELRKEFRADLAGANLVLLGFEDAGAEGCIYKVYLEYWDRLREKLRAGMPPGRPHLLHKGFKWYVQEPARNVVTFYECPAELDGDAIRQRIEALYGQAPGAAGRDATLGILEAARRHAPNSHFLFLEVSERGNPRRSFDLNVYPAGMRVGHIAGRVRSAAAAMAVPRSELDRLLSMIADRPFGHVSGGLSRDGEEYFTFYYER